MKRLLLLLPLLFIAGCGGYGSQLEAGMACKEWSFGEGTFRKGYLIDKAVTEGIRSCINEGATRQVLGMEHPKAEAGTFYKDDRLGSFRNGRGKVLGPKVIKKRFKY